jgi:Tfp pilus assembly PilM family ATPase
MTRFSRTIIGVDIGQHTIKAAQLQTGGGRPRVYALLLLPRPQPEKEIGAEDIVALQKNLNRQGFRGQIGRASCRERV